MPPAPDSPRQPNLPSQLLAAAVTAFRNIATTIQGTEDPSNRLDQIASSIGEAATMFERIAATESTYEQQFNQQANTVAQVQQQINQQATINSQLNSGNQDTARELSNLRQAMQTLQAQTTTGNQTGTNTNRKPLCESRSVSNLKMLGSKKEDFKNWNERLINSTTQVFGPEWRKFIKHLNEKLDVDRKVLTLAEIGLIPHVNQVPEPRRCDEELYFLMVEKNGR